MYQKKPLPPIPATKREAETDRLSEEINQIFKTAQGSTKHEASQGPAENQINWAKEEAKIAVILDSRIRRNISPAPSSSLFPGARKRSRQLLRMETNVGGMANAPNNEATPQPKSAIRKILELTGEKAKHNSLPSPSGHNSPHKIKQLTGTELLSESSVTETSIEFLPLSCNSSVYSQDMDIPYSEAESLETSSSYDMGYASDPSSSYVNQRAYLKSSVPRGCSPLPSPLNLVKIQEAKKSNSGAHKSSLSTNDIKPRGESNEPWLAEYPTGNKYDRDLYHMTTAQIARNPYLSTYLRPIFHHPKPPPRSRNHLLYIYPPADIHVHVHIHPLVPPLHPKRLRIKHKHRHPAPAEDDAPA
ncbi:hypothetical protein B0T16DRAFT_386047 [Cercophora newfieldiana]|uniref:Uncharacterized protein n=1 Tax=Cercophora newfieldiana TaxID=92897 RepID=A0AA39YRX1_9PEZI|nr:hypothetical protein B0T16DRAFT_386047 [Cercophora newfieldiana]